MQAQLCIIDSNKTKRTVLLKAMKYAQEMKPVLKRNKNMQQFP